MQNKIKFIFLSALILVGGIAVGVQAVTIIKSLTITSTSSIVTRLGFGGTIINGSNVCPAHCESGYYAQTIFIDGVSQGTTNISCNKTAMYTGQCGYLIKKTTTYSCRYTTSVKTWGACNANGIQYATGYNYNTVAGSSCSDRAPSQRVCTPPSPVCTPNNCAQNTCTGSTCWNGCATVNGNKVCPPPVCIPNNCAQNTCTGSTCWNGCATVNGNKSCPPPCTPANPNCMQDTCIGGNCWNGCATVSGAKDCRDLNWREVSPN